jgi:predicted RNA binding protein YcfA (HicA-like mRNA interferase family)
MPLSGEDMLRLDKKDGWIVVHQKGSHVQVKKGNLHETIPLHKELKKGLEQVLIKSLKAKAKKDELSL